MKCRFKICLFCAFVGFAPVAYADDLPALSIPIDQPTPADQSQGAGDSPVLIPIMFSSGTSDVGTASSAPTQVQQSVYQPQQQVGVPQAQQTAQQQGSWQPQQPVPVQQPQQIPVVSQQIPLPTVPPTQSVGKPVGVPLVPSSQQNVPTSGTQQLVGDVVPAIMPNPSLNLLRQGAVVTLRSALNNKLLRVEGGVVRAKGTDKNDPYCQFVINKTANVISFRQSGQYLCADKNTQAVVMRGTSLNDDAAKWNLKVLGQRAFASVALQNVASTGVLTMFDPLGVAQWHQGKAWTAAAGPLQVGPLQPASADNILTAQQLCIDIDPQPDVITTMQTYLAAGKNPGLGLFGSYSKWWKLPTAGKGSIKFTVTAPPTAQAQRNTLFDIRVAISDSAKYSDAMYDIIFGGNGNTATFVRKSFRGTDGSFQGIEEKSFSVTIPNQPGTACSLMVAIDKDLGTITITGGSTTLTYQDPSFINNVQYVSLSSEQAVLQYNGILPQ